MPQVGRVGRPVALHQPLVAVHGGGQEGQDLGQAPQQPGHVAPEGAAHLERVRLVEEDVPVPGPEALMAVAPAARELRVPPRHEAGHEAEARRDLLDRGLEEDGAVRGLERVRGEDRALGHAGARLGVQALERHAERGQVVHERGEVGPVLAHAQDRVPEHPRRHRLRVHPALRRQRGRRLLEVEPLVLHPAGRREAGLLRPRRRPSSGAGAGTRRAACRRRPRSRPGRTGRRRPRARGGTSPDRSAPAHPGTRCASRCTSRRRSRRRTSPSRTPRCRTRSRPGPRRGTSPCGRTCRAGCRPRR